MPECLGCGLTSGAVDLPGGRIHAAKYWVVEHCVGPLPVGTLIVKPFRHCTRPWELSEDEWAELGPLLRRVTTTIRQALSPDQIYICLWSHAGWEPGHLHFVLQPSWNHMQNEHKKPGPFLQVDVFREAQDPPREEVEAFAAQARSALGADSSSGGTTA